MPDVDLYATYRRIMKAAERGKGVRLSADEVFAMSLDTAVAQVEWNAREEEADQLEAPDAD